MNLKQIEALKVLGRKLRKSEEGSVNASGVLIMLVSGFVGLMFVLEITPLIETEIAATTITNTLTLAILGFAEWVVPIGALLGIFYGAFRMMKGGV